MDRFYKCGYGSRLLIIMACLWLCMACQPIAQSLVSLSPEISKSDVDDEAKSLFPAPDYPFSQKANHCGGIDWTAIVPDKPLCINTKKGSCITDFSQACDFHDRCYMWLGSNQNACDTEFYSMMLQQCESNPKAGNLQKNTCKNIANVYYQAVHNVGNKYFNRIQKRQELYETWLKAWLDFRPQKASTTPVVEQ